MKFNKMLIALDLSKMDEKLIKYSHFIAQNFGLTSTGFMHVVSDASSPENLIYSYENIIEKDPLLLSKRRKKLEKKIKPVFETLKGGENKIFTMEGNPRKQILKVVQDEKIDLLVVGKKQLSGGSGVKARKVARKVKSAVWFVTEGATTDLQKILVPIDFSDNSFRALKAVLDLKEQFKNITIIVLHIIPIPKIGYKISRNADAIIAELKSSAMNEFLQFLNRNQVDKSNIKFQMLMNDEFNVAKYDQFILSK